jgi:hypothetical protein
MEYCIAGPLLNWVVSLKTAPMSSLRFWCAIWCRVEGLVHERGLRCFTLGLPFVVAVWAESPGNNRHFLTFVRLEAPLEV